MSRATLPNRMADDLFESSSMTFGQHLEELRKALARAAAWVAVGMIFSLYFADDVIQYIQMPLKKALDSYNLDLDKARLEKLVGQSLPQELAQEIRDAGLVSEDVYVDPQDLLLKAGIDPQSGSAPKPEVVKEATSANPAEPPKDASATPVQPATPKADVARVLPLPTAPDAETMKRLHPIRIWRAVEKNVETLNVQESFMIWLKALLILGIVFGSPGIFWHIWQFVAAGLYPHERRYVYVFLPMSLGLFLAGVCLAFFVIFELVIGFLLSVNKDLGTTITPRLEEYVSFALILPLGFGVAFQLPLVMVFLHRVGVFTVSTYLKQWKIAVLVICFLSMVLTPSGDVYSMLGMAGPLVLLYFLGVLLCVYLPMGRGLGSGGYDPA